MNNFTLFVVGSLSGLIALLAIYLAYDGLLSLWKGLYNKDAEKRELRKNLNDNNMYKQYGRQPYNWETGE